ncbi:MAG: cyclophilin-like fold protein [Candidatus Bipolaricaulia bacterium]
MGKQIEIMIDEQIFAAELNDTQTAKWIYEALPIQASGNFWGEEIYFEIPVKLENEKPKQEVEVGDLAYWPPGRGFCIFYGPTPASTGDKPKAASDVTVIGKVKDPQAFKTIDSAANIEIRQID